MTRRVGSGEKRKDRTYEDRLEVNTPEDMVKSRVSSVDEEVLLRLSVTGRRDSWTFSERGIKGPWFLSQESEHSAFRTRRLGSGVPRGGDGDSEWPVVENSEYPEVHR